MDEQELERLAPWAGETERISGGDIMTDRERYRAAFAVKAPERAVRLALEGTHNRPRRRRTTSRILLAAALVGALLVTSVSAEIDSGAVSNLLAPYFGSARTELLEKFGRPVGASASAGGYTVTADAIIGDRGCMQVIYTLTREDGQPIPEHVKFLDIDYALSSGSTSCSTVYPRTVSAPNESQFYQKFFADFGLSRKVRVSFGRLVISDGSDRELELLAEGPWELSFIRRCPDTTRSVPVKDLSVTDQSGQSCHIRTLSCSCLGLTITGTIPFSESDAGPTLDLAASVTLKDGSVLPLQAGFSAEHSGHSTIWTFTSHARYRDQDGFGLLDPDNITVITLCDVMIPVPS